MMVSENGAAVTAQAIIQLATKVQTFGAIHLFTEEVETAGDIGRMVQLTMQGPSQMKLFLNSNLLKDILLQQYKEVGGELEAAGIDMTQLVDDLNKAKLQEAAQQ